MNVKQRKGILKIEPNDPPVYGSYDYELKLRTELKPEGSTYDMELLIGSEYYSYEERLNALVALVEYEYEVSKIAMEVFPDKKMYGSFFYSGYEYPTIEVGYYDRHYFTFCNFDGPLHGASYHEVPLAAWRIDEYKGDGFFDNCYTEDEEQLKKDIIEKTGYNIRFQ